MNTQSPYAKVWEENVVIPTYGTGSPEKNPMFFEKRVYQGSQGKVYPLPVIDKILDEKKDVHYRAVFLENEYLRVMVLPELGGRIQRAYDKTNGYDFVYHNEVIKPALVGLAGPWISGGIEFNWPQHHRPSTYMPVEYTLLQQDDGSAAVRLSEVDRMYGTKSLVSITLHPGKAYIQIDGRFYNPTALAQTFLWWANPAVAVHDETQSIFPPDVHHVMDHGKRDMSAFPIADGIYYKYDYSPGTDISRYKNIPVPTSFMAYHSDYDFVGGYDHRKRAGILHVADHHISPGKKQWTWGSGDFGKAWDRNLTDENGPYIELMTGVYTDNQPDFTWLMPGEEKTFTQFFLPYQEVGEVTNATQDLVMGMQRRSSTIRIAVYASSAHEGHTVQLTLGKDVLFEQTADLTPTRPFIEEVVFQGEPGADLVLKILDPEGQVVLSSVPDFITPDVSAAQATALPLPAEIQTIEELYLAGLHLEQYRHATRASDDYYLEGLARDPKDIRCNTTYGMLLIRRGQFRKSELFFRQAMSRATWKNPNPYDSEAHYGLGLACYFQGKLDEAIQFFHKAAWSAAQKPAAFYYLGSIAAVRGEWKKALEFSQRSLEHGTHHLKARVLQAWMLYRLARTDEAVTLCEETLRIDPFCHACALLVPQLGASSVIGDTRRVIDTALLLMEAGAVSEAVDLLQRQPGDEAMLKYHLAWAMSKAGLPYEKQLLSAGEANLDYAFPNRLEDMLALQFALQENPKDGTAAYCLGNLLYDKKRYEEAADLWALSAENLPTFATPLRNLAIYAFNKQGDPEKALALMERAFALDTNDARVLMELDQLRKRYGIAPATRHRFLQQHMDLVMSRDDLVCEHVTLLNYAGLHDQALDIILRHRFHPWEGGEGKVPAQYRIALMEMAKSLMARGGFSDAEELLKRALHYPENLGEGKLIGSKDNDIHYLLGRAQSLGGHAQIARESWERAAAIEMDLKNAQYYYDQPADMVYFAAMALRELGREADADRLFSSLENYGDEHMDDIPTLDYFAVSLPEMQVFDEDLALRNREHCLYLKALGAHGLGKDLLAEGLLHRVLETSPAHIGASLQLRSMKKGEDERK